jgi:predicted ester cyclase
MPVAVINGNIPHGAGAATFKATNSSPSDGTALFGHATAPSGATSGVFGLANSPAGAGVWGYSDNFVGIGVKALSTLAWLAGAQSGRSSMASARHPMASALSPVAHGLAAPQQAHGGSSGFPSCLTRPSDTKAGVTRCARHVVSHGTGDIVAAHTHFTVTHRGMLHLGTWGPWPPTGKSIDMKEMIFFHLAEGKIAGVWDSWDGTSFDQQLGGDQPRAATTT